MANDWGDNPLQDIFDQWNGLSGGSSASGTGTGSAAGDAAGGSPSPGIQEPTPGAGAAAGEAAAGDAAAAAGGGGALKGILGSIFSKETLQSLFVWQIMSQLLGGALAPVTNGLQRLSDDAFPLVPLSPADLADAAVRGFRDQGKARAMARQSGIDGPDFDTMVQLAGDAPAPTTLAEALRRKIIPEDSGSPDKPGFIQGIREGRLADKWAPIIKALSMALPSPSDVLDAYLQGQTDEATAKQLYEAFGGDPSYFQLMYDTRGSAPTPLEAIQMANRGIISWNGTGPKATSYEQAFLEGPWRNKWMEPYKKLGQYIPPPTHITTLVRDGGISHDQAISYFKQNGMDQATAEAYLQAALGEKMAGSKQLAESTITKLYQDRLIDKTTAEQMLETVGYSKTDAEYILQVIDVIRAQAALNSAITKVQSLYIGHKLSKTDAVNALNALQVPPKEVEQIIKTWDLEVQANVKTLTESQIADAFYYEIVDQATAQAMLESIGYQPHDAWTVLSVKAKGALPGEPPKDALVVPGP